MSTTVVVFVAGMLIGIYLTLFVLLLWIGRD